MVGLVLHGDVGGNQCRTGDAGAGPETGHRAVSTGQHVCSTPLGSHHLVVSAVWWLRAGTTSAAATCENASDAAALAGVPQIPSDISKTPDAPSRRRLAVAAPPRPDRRAFAQPGDSSVPNTALDEVLVFAAGVFVLAFVPFLIGVVALRSSLVTTLAEAFGSH